MNLILGFCRPQRKEDQKNDVLSGKMQSTLYCTLRTVLNNTSAVSSVSVGLATLIELVSDNPRNTVLILPSIISHYSSEGEKRGMEGNQEMASSDKNVIASH